MWKQRLLQAIETGGGDLDVAKVRVDDQCDFGKWLHYETAPDLRSSSHYGEVKGLHAKSHGAAAEVLQAAKAGRKDQAHALLAPGASYAKTSAELTRAMMDWKASLN